MKKCRKNRTLRATIALSLAMLLTFGEGVSAWAESMPPQDTPEAVAIAEDGASDGQELTDAGITYDEEPGEPVIFPEDAGMAGEEPSAGALDGIEAPPTEDTGEATPAFSDEAEPILLEETKLAPEGVSSGEAATKNDIIEPTGAVTDSGECGAHLAWTLYDDGRLVISGVGAMDDYTSGSAPWYSQKVNITSVTVEKGATRIGNYAFADCTNIAGISICEGITVIGDYAFKGCSGIGTLTVPVGVDTIGQYAFSGCSSLATINFPETKLKIIGQYAFESTAVKEIEIPNCVTSLGSGAFKNCQVLEKVTLPDSISYINPYTFFRNYKLSSITIPEGILSIRDYAFYECQALESISLPDSLTWIGKWAFCNDDRILNMTIPKAVEEIDDFAFFECDRLVCVAMMGGVSRIGQKAFYNCGRLRNISLPASLLTVGYGAYYGCGRMRHVYYAGTELQWKNITIYTNSSTSSVEIASGMYVGGGYNNYSSERYYSYYNDNSNLYSTANKHYNVPANSFMEAAHLEENDITSDMIWEISDGVLLIDGSGMMYEYGSASAMPWYEKRQDITKIVVSPGITTIADHAFEDLIATKTVSIPETVKTIGNDAFYNCSALQAVTIPDFVIEIYDHAFENCVSLKSTLISNSIDHIPASCFSGCSALEDIRFGSCIKSIYNNAFLGCGSLKSVEFPDSLKYIYANAFEACISLQTLDLPDSVVSLQSHVFDGCSKLASVKLSNNLQTIPSYAFFRCKSLRSITIPGSVGGIGDFSFYECSRLDTLTIEPGVRYVGAWAFCNDDYLRNVTLPNGLKTVYEFAFFECDRLVNVVALGGLETIKEKAFYNCGRLRRIYVPSSLNTVGYGAFYGCGRLEKVYFTGTESQWVNITINTNSSTSSVEIASGMYVGGGYNNYSSERYYSYYNDNSRLSNALKDYEADMAEISLEVERDSKDIESAVSWELDENDILVIRGTGNMFEYGSAVAMPWYGERMNIYGIRIEPGVTSIADYAFAGLTGAETVSIPSTVHTIGTHAFDGCKSLAGAFIPDSVTRIYSQAFLGCSSLQQVRLSNGITLIDEECFKDCVSLLGIVVGYNIKSIKNSAFSGCSSLINAYFTPGVETIGSGVFSDCSALSTVTLPDTLTSIGSYAFSGCRSLSGIVIPDSVLTIGSYGFKDCSNFQWIKLSSKLQYISGGLFFRCKKLINIEIPNSATYINSYAFYECAALQNISFSTATSGIGEWAFCNCDHIVNLSLPASLKTIEAFAFFECNGLESVSMKRGTESIGARAFYDCTRLERLYFPNSITSVGYGAFYGCSRLAMGTVYYRGNQVQWDDIAMNSNSSTSGVEIAPGMYVGGGYNNYSSERYYNYYNDNSPLINAEKQYSITTLPAVTGVSINKTSMTKTVYETETLTVTVQPDNAFNQYVRWSSTDPSVASVTNAGVVSAKAPGTAVIKAVTEDGGYEASCTVSVNGLGETVEVSDVTVEPTNLMLKVGDVSNLSVSVLPASASDNSVSWRTTEANVATVDSTGTVTAKEAGVTMVIATAGNKSDYCLVSVEAEKEEIQVISVNSITLEPTEKTLEIGETLQLTTDVLPENADNKKVFFSSSKEEVATVSIAGKVRAVAEGNAVITAKTMDQGLTASCNIIVNPKKLQVSYDPGVGSGTMPGLEVYPGGKVTLSENGFKAPTGMTFKAWSVEGQEYQPGAELTINKETTIVAIWEGLSFKASFNANGGSTETAEMTVTYGKTYCTLPQASRDGYDFAGWYTQVEGGTQVKAETTVTETTNHTLYAHWTKKQTPGPDPVNEVTVTLNANGGTVSESSIKVTSGQAYGALPQASRDGYDFAGWYTQVEGGTQVKAETTVTETTNHTLYAHWTKKQDPGSESANEITVTLSSNGGNIGTKNIKVKTGQPYGTLPEPARKGYTFKGWYTAVEGGTQVTPETTVTESTDHTLYARWEKRETPKEPVTADSFRVTFYVQDEQLGEVMTVKAGDTVDMKDAPEKAGCVFAGWYTEEGSAWDETMPVFRDLDLNARYIRKDGKEDPFHSGRDSEIELWEEKDLYVVKGQKFNLSTDTTWSSENSTVVKITKGYQAEAKKNGKVNVTNADKSLTYIIHVVTPKLSVAWPEDQKNKKNLQLVEGNKGTLQLDGMTETVNGKAESVEDEYDITWYSSDIEVAKVDDGMVIGVSKGNAKITAYIGGKAYTFPVKVTDIYGISEYAGDISLTPLQSVKVKFKRGEFKLSGETVWSSSMNLVPVMNKKGKVAYYQNKIVRITPAGKMTAIGVGSTVLMAKNPGSDTMKAFKLTVTNIAPKTVYLNVGKTKNVKFYNMKFTGQSPAKWQVGSSSQAIVDVNKGKVKAKAVGKAKVLYHYDPYNTGGFDYTVLVYAEDPSLKEGGGLALKSGSNYTLELKSGDTYLLEMKDVFQQVTFMSNKKGVVFVDEMGVVSARGKGTAKLTAKVNGKKFTVTVKVNE